MSPTQSSLPIHTMTPPCPLLTLSTELILQIIHFVPPESHLDFALSCQQVYACSLDIVHRHRDAYAKYRVTSDLDPTTIPSLLRSATRNGPDDWIDLWHVRAIEIWRDRMGWDEWKTYDFKIPVQDSRNAVVEWKWRDGEIADCLDELGDKLDEEGYERADKEIREGKDGILKCLVIGMCPRLTDLRFVAQEHDEGTSMHWLKTVVDRYAKDQPQAPAEFRKWEFSDDLVELDGDWEDIEEDDDEDDEEYDEEGESEEDQDDEIEVDELELDELKLNDDDVGYSSEEPHQASLALIRENALQAHMSVLSKYWPPGLFSLLNLAVGIPSSTWLDTRSDTPSTPILCTLLRLPNITSLYYANLSHLDDDPVNYTHILPAKCSSLKHLFLDNCDGSNSPHLFSEALVAAPENLLTAAFRSGEAHLEHSDDFVAGFGRHQSGSLESLMFYDYGRGSPGSIHGYRCTAYKPDEFDNFSVIKQLSISISDIELGCLYQDSDRCTDDEFYVKYASTCFPASLECLVLWDEPGSGHSGDKKGATDVFERAVVKMIKDKNKEYEYEDEEEDEGEEENKKTDEEEEREKQKQKQYEEGEGDEYLKDLASGLDPDKHYPNFKAVYLEEIESHKPRWADETSKARTKIGFEDAIAIGMKEGVDVHTLMNRGEMLHEISFPEAPDMYSLESGPHWGTRPGDWVFNPYIGRRVPKGCGKCGRCEKCFEEYPKKFWDSLEG